MSVGDGTSTGYLCVVSVVRNESDGIIEWVDYHLNVAGVDHMFLWLDRTGDPGTDDTRELLCGLPRVTLLECNLVHLVASEGWFGPNYPFNRSLSALRGRYKWAAVIDCDEFLRPVSDRDDASLDVKDVLRRFEHVGGLAVSWRTFGSMMAHTTESDRSVLASYVVRDPDRRQICVKTIVNLDNFVGRFRYDPHLPVADPEGGERGAIVNTRGDAVTTPTCAGVYDVIVLHHYMAKSYQFWVANKLPKSAELFPNSDKMHYRATVWFGQANPDPRRGLAFSVFDDSLAKVSARPPAPMRILIDSTTDRTVAEALDEWRQQGFPRDRLTTVSRPTDAAELECLWRRWVKVPESEILPYFARHGDFDAEFYMAQNPDVAQAGVDPWLHYVMHGKAEGRAKNHDEHTRIPAA